MNKKVRRLTGTGGIAWKEAALSDAGKSRRDEGLYMGTADKGAILAQGNGREW